MESRMKKEIETLSEKLQMADVGGDETNNR